MDRLTPTKICFCDACGFKAKTANDMLNGVVFEEAFDDTETEICKECLEKALTRIKEKMSKDAENESSFIVEKEVQSLLSLPWVEDYRLKEIPKEDGGEFCAYIPLFGENGCRSDGDTPEEAVKNLKKVLESKIRTYIEKGWTIPTPTKISARKEKEKDEEPFETLLTLQDLKIYKAIDKDFRDSKSTAETKKSISQKEAIQMAQAIGERAEKRRQEAIEAEAAESAIWEEDQECTEGDQMAYDEEQIDSLPVLLKFAAQIHTENNLLAELLIEAKKEIERQRHQVSHLKDQIELFNTEKEK